MKQEAGGSASSAKPRGGGGKKISGSVEKSIKPQRGWNAFGYSYPEESGAVDGEGRRGSDGAPVVLRNFGEESAVTVFVDNTSRTDPTEDVPSYDCYFASLGGSHSGLGFQGDGEQQVEGMEEEEEKAKEAAVVVTESSPVPKGNKKKNAGFLSIGGLSLYTEDISSPDEDSDGLLDDNDEDYEDDDGDSVEEKFQDSAEDSTSDSEEEEDSSEDDTVSDDYGDVSDIDEEVMEDYLAGIGGADELLKAEWLAENLEEYDMDNSSTGDSSDQSAEKLGPLAVMKLSKEYGMQRAKEKKKKVKRSNSGSNLGLPIRANKSTPSDDLLFAKDRRAISGKKTRDYTVLSRSWPSNTRKSKMDKKIRGKENYILEVPTTSSKCYCIFHRQALISGTPVLFS